MNGRPNVSDLVYRGCTGLRYAFPKMMRRLERKVPRVAATHERVAQRPRVAAYLASERRIAFNQMGIFRHYKELDG